MRDLVVRSVDGLDGEVDEERTFGRVVRLDSVDRELPIQRSAGVMGGVC